YTARWQHVPFGEYRIRMNRLMLVAVATLVFGLGLAAQTPPAKRAPKTTPTAANPSQTPAPPMAAAHPPTSSAVDSQNAMVKQYCAGCHSEKGKAGQLSLANFDAGQAAEN